MGTGLQAKQTPTAIPWQASESAPATLGLTDYQALAQPHVAPLQALFTGQRSRYKLRFEDAIFVLDHGCLMGRILHHGKLFALPVFERDSLRDTPYLRALPPHQAHWLTECLSLPRSLLLFYFTLMKDVFAGASLTCRWEDPASGRHLPHPMPQDLHDILAEVGWDFTNPL